MKASACATAALAWSHVGGGLLRVGDDLGVVDLGQELVPLHAVAVVDVELLEVARDLGVEVGLLVGVDRTDLGRGPRDPAPGEAGRLDGDRLVRRLRPRPESTPGTLGLSDRRVDRLRVMIPGRRAAPAANTATTMIHPNLRRFAGAAP